MFFEESNVEGNGDDDSEIVHSNDDFDMSPPSPVQSQSTPLENTSSIYSRICSIGRRQKRKYDDTGSEFFVVEMSQI
jgi:hypothetical protein